MEKISFEELATVWLQEKRPYVKATSFSTYWTIVRKTLVPFFGKMTDLSEEDVQSFVLKQIGSGHKQKTVRDQIMVLKLIVRIGYKKGLFSFPSWEIHYPTSQEESKVVTLSVSDHRKLLKSLRENFSFRNFAIEVCLCTGIRIGELCALQWKDFDMAEHVVKIRKTCGRLRSVEGGPSVVFVGSPKTECSARDIPLSKELIAKLKCLLKVVNPDAYIVDNSLKPTDPRVLRFYFRKLCVRTGVQEVKFHGLRHSFATRCIEGGCDYKTVSVLLGHSNISTTMNLYVHPDLDQKKRCIAKMERILK